MRLVRQMGLIALALVLVSSSAFAQRTSARRASSGQSTLWEFGADARLSFGLDNPKVTTLSVPVQNLRAGFFVNDQWEVEPFFSLNYVNVSGGGSITAYTFGSGALYHFSTDRLHSQLYLRPFLGIVGASVNPAGAGASTSSSDAAFGFGVGMKWPKLNGRIAWRGEVNLESVNSNTAINLLWGLSLFSR